MDQVNRKGEAAEWSYVFTAGPVGFVPHVVCNTCRNFYTTFVRGKYVKVSLGRVCIFGVFPRMPSGKDDGIFPVWRFDLWTLRVGREWFFLEMFYIQMV